MDSKVRVWFSGVFGAGAIAHILRLVFRVPVTIGNFQVPMELSVWVAVAAVVLSLALLGVCPCCCAGNKCGK